MHSQSSSQNNILVWAADDMKNQSRHIEENSYKVCPPLMLRRSHRKSDRGTAPGLKSFYGRYNGEYARSWFLLANCLFETSHESFMRDLGERSPTDPTHDLPGILRSLSCSLTLLNRVLRIWRFSQCHERADFALRGELRYVFGEEILYLYDNRRFRQEK